jgi:hypothetical protein
MSIKVTAFALAFMRWVALVALALVPTIIVVVAWRKLRGEPLWSLKDLPVAAEVTLCLAWLSVLLGMLDMLKAHADGWPALAIVAAAAVGAACPAAFGLSQIDELRRVIGLLPRRA